MSRNPQKVSPASVSALAAVLLNTVVLRTAATGNPQWYGVLLLTLPLAGVALVGLARARRNL